MEEEKWCSKCGSSKPVSEFGKDSSAKDNYTCQCKICRYAIQKLWRQSNPGKVKAKNDRTKANRDSYYYKPENKLKYRKAALKKSFGIEYSDYEALEKAQHGLCAICRLPERDSRCKYLAVDHDHDTGKIRGLLCGPCNRALGHLLDSVDVVERALQYLLKHKQQSEFTSD